MNKMQMQVVINHHEAKIKELELKIEVASKRFEVIRDECHSAEGKKDQSCYVFSAFCTARRGFEAINKPDFKQQ